MTRACLLLVVATLLLSLAVARARGDPDSIVDEDYRFRLDCPGKGWSLLSAEEVTRIVPDALAGAVKRPALVGVVIAEAVPGDDLDLESYARLTLDNMPMERPETHQFGRIRFLDHDAVRFQASGTVTGVRLVYRSVVVLRGGYAFQIVCWAPETGADQHELEAFAHAFSFLPGEIRGRSSARETLDQHGVGWRVKDGVFESAVYGLAVKPQGDWRLAIGAELAQMNPDAEVGLVRGSPDVFVTVIAEYAAGVDQEAFRRASLAAGTEDIGATPTGKPHTLDIAGRQVRVQKYATAGPPAAVLHKSAFFVGDACVQIVAWHLGSGEKLQGVIEEGYAAIRVLEAEELKQLSRALHDAPDPRESTGHGYALRGGLYRSFEFGLTWEAPEGWWRLRAGHEARQENPDASLLIEAPEVGLYGTLIAESALGFTPDTFHEAATTGVFGEGAPELETPPRAIRLGKASGKVTSGSFASEGTEFDFHIVTCVHRGRAVQLILHGMSSNLARRPEALEGAIRALRIHRELRPVSEQAGRIEDWRLGYSFRPPGQGWTHKDITPVATRSVSSAHSWTRGAEMIVALGVCGLQEGQDAAWFEGFLAEGMGALLGARSLLDAKRSAVRIAGRDAQRLESRRLLGREIVYILGRGRSFYALIFRMRLGREPTEAEIVAAFALLD